MSRQREHDLQTVLDAIYGQGRWQPKDPQKDGNSFGNISVVAKRLGVSRQTVYSYLRTWKSVEDAIDECRETFGDYVEGKMADEIMKGNTTLMIFYAKTKLKDRGYVERQEFEHSGNIESKLIILPQKDGQ